MAHSKHSEVKSTLDTEVQIPCGQKLPFQCAELAKHSAEWSFANRDFNYKYITIGGVAYNSVTTSFHELCFDKKSNAIKTFESVNNKYNKKNADLSKIGLENARYLQSCTTSDNKFIIVFGRQVNSVDNDIYNVYDLKNDKWLIDVSKMNDICVKVDFEAFAWNDGFRSILLFDRLLILSRDNDLMFYDLGDDLTTPTKVGEYIFKTVTEDYDYRDHGFSLIKFEKKNNNHINNGKEYNVYNVVFALYGGHGAIPLFFESFLQVSMDINVYVSNDDDDDNINNSKFQVLNFEDKHIDFMNDHKGNIKWKAIKNKNVIDLKSKLRGLGAHDYFGFESFCVKNYKTNKNESVIIMIGGQGVRYDEKYQHFYDLNMEESMLIIKFNFDLNQIQVIFHNKVCINIYIQFVYICVLL